MSIIARTTLDRHTNLYDHLDERNDTAAHAPTPMATPASPQPVVQNTEHRGRYDGLLDVALATHVMDFDVHDDELRQLIAYRAENMDTIDPPLNRRDVLIGMALTPVVLAVTAGVLLLGGA